MKLVMIESPYWSKNKEQLKQNIEYAKKCLLDSLNRGEAPFASHLLYTRVLKNDAITKHRYMGLSAAFAWAKKADLVAVYIDLGFTAGINKGIQNAQKNKIPIEYRRLNK